jgi:hypothetical protein
VAGAVTLVDTDVSTTSAFSGAGGAITLTAQGPVTLEQSTLSANATHRTGSNLFDADVTVTTPDTLTIRGGGLTAQTRGTRDAGDVLLNVGALHTQAGSTSVAVAGEPTTRVVLSSSSTGEYKQAGRTDGKAGQVLIQGPTPGTLPTEVALTATDVSTEVRDGGVGGAILIGSTGSLNLSNVTVAARVLGGNQPGGSITLRARETTRLAEQSLVSTDSAGQGDAGDITIHAGRTFRSINSAVSSEASQASGGNVTLIAEDLVHLTNSQLTTSVAGGPQTVGGQILIDPRFIVLLNSRIVAQANQGAGGTINLVAGTLLVDPSSLISASSQSGPQGTVTIQSPIQNLSGALVPLQQSLLSITPLLSQRCAARMSEGKVSTFVVTLREGLPPEPGGPLPSPLEDLDLAVAQSETRPLLVASVIDPLSLRLLGTLASDPAANQVCRR